MIESLTWVNILLKLEFCSPVTLGYLPYFVNFFGEGIDKILCSFLFVLLALSACNENVLLKPEVNVLETEQEQNVKKLTPNETFTKLRKFRNSRQTKCSSDDGC